MLNNFKNSKFYMGPLHERKSALIEQTNSEPRLADVENRADYFIVSEEFFSVHLDIFASTRIKNVAYIQLEYNSANRSDKDTFYTTLVLNQHMGYRPELEFPKFPERSRLLFFLTSVTLKLRALQIEHEQSKWESEKYKTLLDRLGNDKKSPIDDHHLGTVSLFYTLPQSPEKLFYGFSKSFLHYVIQNAASLKIPDDLLESLKNRYKKTYQPSFIRKLHGFFEGASIHGKEPSASKRIEPAWLQFFDTCLKNINRILAEHNLSSGNNVPKEAFPLNPHKPGWFPKDLVRNAFLIREIPELLERNPSPYRRRKSYVAGPGNVSYMTAAAGACSNC